MISRQGENESTRISGWRKIHDDKDSDMGPRRGQLTWQNHIISGDKPRTTNDIVFMVELVEAHSMWIGDDSRSLVYEFIAHRGCLWRICKMDNDLLKNGKLKNDQLQTSSDRGAVK